MSKKSKARQEKREAQEPLIEGKPKEKKPMKRWQKVVCEVASLVLVVLIVTGIYILTQGLPLSGTPKPSNVESITVRHGEMDGEITDYSDSENIEQACKLLGFLNYVPFAEASEADGPDILITYNLKDGKRLVAAANKETVWWRGKSYPIKKQEMFLNLAHGIFHLDDSEE